MEQRRYRSEDDQATLLVAAIDFGTTFSGYAFSFRHEFQKDPMMVRASNWMTGSRVAISLKTSTCVLFDPGRNFNSFGFEAEEKYCDLTYDMQHSDWYYFRRFKMMLYEAANVYRTTMLKDETGKEMPAMEVFSAAIKYLTDHLLRTLRDMTAGDIEKNEIKWVVTVPAIWNDAAKQFTREAAEQAGIPGRNLLLALEPEAASMFCKYLPVEKLAGDKGQHVTCFKPGSRYLVLDAGGGTVDITVHEVQRDGTLHELFKANGGPWGGTTVDKQFLSFIQKIVGPEVWKRFSSEHTDDYMDLIREFEIKKRSITPELDARMTFRIPITLHEIYRDMAGDDLRTAVKNIPELTGKITFAGDKLRADPEIVKSLFRETCEKIVEHVQKILQEPMTRGTDAVLMVGGFSESSMLRHAMETAFPRLRTISPHEAGLAVLKGAVIFGHDQNVITERISKFTYGISMRCQYDPKLHPNASKENLYQDRRRITMIRGTFSKLVEIGQPVSAERPCIGKEPYVPSDSENGGTGFTLKLFASTEKNPIYIDDPGCRKIGEVHVDCRDQHGRVGSATVNLIFGKTELEVEAINSFNARTRAKFDFLD